MPDTKQPFFERYMTYEQAQHLLFEIEQLLPAVYKTQAGSFLEILNKQIRLSTKDALLSLLEQNNIPYTDTERLHPFLMGIKTTLQEYPVLTFTLPIEPTAETVSLLTTWLEKNNIKPCILQIKVDPKILAGCIIDLNGKYKDYSLSHELLPRIQKMGREMLTGTV